MSCRKFSSPRHGNLGFRPKVRAKNPKSSIRAFPKDKSEDPIHLTGFIGFKAGMTHVIRTKEVRHKNKVHTKEVFDAVTILETPAMKAIGIAGYRTTLQGQYRHKIIMTEKLDEGVCRRIFNLDWLSKIRSEGHQDLRNAKGYTEEDIKDLVDNSDSIRLICATQVSKIASLKQRKCHIIELQVNGGATMQEKVAFCVSKLNSEICVSDVFAKDEIIDAMAITKGKGVQGTVKRWGSRILPAKSNKGIRKVACIGAWHPSNVLYSVARAGQCGSHRRTQQNLHVYGVGNGLAPVKTVFDLTEKCITPMGGFPHYGVVKNDYILLKGSISGPLKKMVTLRKALRPKKVKDVTIKFVDTSSKIGRGRFQTTDEKRTFYGISKSEVNNSN